MSWQGTPPPERPSGLTRVLVVLLLAAAGWLVLGMLHDCARRVVQSAGPKKASAPAPLPTECTGTDAECVVVWRPDWLSERRCTGCAWPARVASNYATGCPVCELPMRVPRVP
jgi:hypothetical protein